MGQLQSTVRIQKASLACPGAACRVLVLNACILVAGVTFSRAGDDLKEKRLDDILNMARFYDVVILQEVWECLWWRSFVASFYNKAADMGFHVVSTSLCGFGLMNTGNVILSRHIVGGASATCFKATSGWQSTMSNGILHACLMLKSGPLHVFNTHLQSDSVPYASILNSSSSDTRRDQAKALIDFMNTKNPRKEPWFLAGDFNFGPFSREYNYMRGALRCESLLAPAFSATYNPDSFLAPMGWRAGEKGMSKFEGKQGCIDHIFSSINPDNLNVKVLSTVSTLSDHFPIEVNVHPP